MPESGFSILPLIPSHLVWNELHECVLMTVWSHWVNMRSTLGSFTSLFFGFILSLTLELERWLDRLKCSGLRVENGQISDPISFLSGVIVGVVATASSLATVQSTSGIWTLSRSTCPHNAKLFPLGKFPSLLFSLVLPQFLWLFFIFLSSGVLFLSTVNMLFSRGMVWT